MSVTHFWASKGSYDYGDAVGHTDISIVNATTWITPLAASPTWASVPVANEAHLRALGNNRKNMFNCGYKDNVEEGDYLLLSFMKSGSMGTSKAVVILRLRNDADHIRVHAVLPRHRVSTANGQMKVFDGCADIVSLQEALNDPALDRVTARTGFQQQAGQAFDTNDLGPRYFFYEVVAKGPPNTKHTISVDDGVGKKKKIIAERVTRKIRIRRT